MLASRMVKLQCHQETLEFFRAALRDCVRDVVLKAVINDELSAWNVVAYDLMLVE